MKIVNIKKYWWTRELAYRWPMKPVKMTKLFKYSSPSQNCDYNIIRRHQTHAILTSIPPSWAQGPPDFKTLVHGGSIATKRYKCSFLVYILVFILVCVLVHILIFILIFILVGCFRSVVSNSSYTYTTDTGQGSQYWLLNVDCILVSKYAHWYTFTYASRTAYQCAYQYVPVCIPVCTSMHTSMNTCMYTYQ